MRKLGTIDLEILDLAIKENGTFDENSLEGSSLKRLGVGKILDSLASLKDRKMITLNSDGSFSISEMARSILWSSSVPAWANILRLLQVKSCRLDEITGILRIPEGVAYEEIEKMRKAQLVLMSPQRINERIVRVYEIMQDGIEKIDRAEAEGFGDNVFDGSADRFEVHGQIDGIVRDIQAMGASQEEKDRIMEKIWKLKSRLGV